MKSHEAATTPAEIENLLALEEGITPGRWEFGTRKDGSHWMSFGNPSTGPHYQADIFASPHDCRAIAALPQLFTTLRALYARAIKAEAEVAKLKKSVEMKDQKFSTLKTAYDKERRKNAPPILGSAAAQASAMKEGE